MKKNCGVNVFDKSNKNAILQCEDYKTKLRALQSIYKQYMTELMALNQWTGLLL